MARGRGLISSFIPFYGETKFDTPLPPPNHRFLSGELFFIFGPYPIIEGFNFLFLAYVHIRESGGGAAPGVPPPPQRERDREREGRKSFIKKERLPTLFFLISILGSHYRIFKI